VRGGGAEADQVVGAAPDLFLELLQGDPLDLEVHHLDLVPGLLEDRREIPDAKRHPRLVDHVVASRVPLYRIYKKNFHNAAPAAHR